VSVDVNVRERERRRERWLEDGGVDVSSFDHVADHDHDHDHDNVVTCSVHPLARIHAPLDPAIRRLALHVRLHTGPSRARVVGSARP